MTPREPHSKKRRKEGGLFRKGAVDILEDTWSVIVEYLENIHGGRPYLPLGVTVASERQEVAPGTEVHSYDNSVSDGVRQDEPGILLGNSPVKQSLVATPAAIQSRLVEFQRFLVFGNFRRDNIRAVIGDFHIPLAFLGITGHAVTHQLVGKSPGPFDTEGGKGKLKTGMVTFADQFFDKDPPGPVTRFFRCRLPAVAVGGLDYLLSLRCNGDELYFRLPVRPGRLSAHHVSPLLSRLARQPFECKHGV